jgi:hypothetical protein
MQIAIDYIQQRDEEKRLLKIGIDELRGKVSHNDSIFLKKLSRQFIIESISFAGRGSFVKNLDNDEYSYSTDYIAGFKYLVRYRDYSGHKFNWTCL